MAFGTLARRGKLHLAKEWRKVWIEPCMGCLGQLVFPFFGGGVGRMV